MFSELNFYNSTIEEVSKVFGPDITDPLTIFNMSLFDAGVKGENK